MVWVEEVSKLDEDWIGVKDIGWGEWKVFGVVKDGNPRVWVVDRCTEVPGSVRERREINQNERVFLVLVWRVSYDTDKIFLGNFLVELKGDGKRSKEHD